MQTRVSPEALKLVCISFLALYFELALIRYTNSTIQVVEYFNNFMILSAILGLGFGSLIVRSGKDFFKYFFVIALAVVGLITFFNSFGYHNVDPNQIFWVGTYADEKKNISVPLVIVLVFIGNFSFFSPIGYKLGELLDRFENRLEGYAYDLLGSLLGMSAFVLLSYLRVSPSGWFFLGGTLAFLLLLKNRLWILVGSIICFAGMILITTLLEKGLWSPYYKVTFQPYHQKISGKNEYLGFGIRVDKLRIQDALKFSPALEKSYLAPYIPYYQLPHQFRPPGRTLILGGGSGNDAAMALMNEAERVTVVEVDPVILEQGFVTHPHRPYRDQRVRIINDDARSYLRRSRENYDLILMNALDSHLQVPGLSTLRLESYMYTVEAFRDVKRLMNPQSIFMVHLSSTRKWMGERLYWSMTEAFGKEPVMLTTKGSPWSSIAFGVGPEGIFDTPRSNDKFPIVHIDPGPMRKLKSGTVLATDDWPHLYLSHPTLPNTYIIVLTALLVFTFAIFRFAIRPGEIIYHLRFFLLGAGFMLLETRSITKSAAMFGSTWIVNAVVIGSILSVVFLANLLVWKERWNISSPLCYAGLFIGLIVGYATPIEFILAYSWGWRVLFVGAWLSFPIFFASILFSRAFQKAKYPHAAFGVNLIGFAVGGVLEYASLIFGLQVLYLIALGIYGLVMVCSPRTVS